jgi:hypothetical protein
VRGASGTRKDLTGTTGTSSFAGVNGDDESDLELHRRQDAHSHRAAIVGLVVCLVLVLGGLFLVYKLKAMSELQDCVMQGRTNCAPIDPSD